MKTLKAFLLLISLTLFVSCEEGFELENLNSENFKSTIDQAYVFQYAEMDENQQWTNGWLMDVEGRIHSYDLAHPSTIQGNATLTQEDLSGFMEVCEEVIGQVDLEDLVEHFKIMCEIQSDFEDNIIASNNLEATFFGIYSNDYNDDCFDFNFECEENNDVQKEPLFKYVPIEANRKTSDGYNIELATTVLDWLISVNQNLK